jgi:ATP-binding cassette subfamily C protein
VLQNARISSAPILENIGTGAPITLDQAWEAAEDAGFAADIHDMPMGMQTVISEGGGNLSGGQRQRLMIARALVRNPRILLFDEATSALDNKTQSIVSKSLNRRKVTRVVIAHRLSTIREADNIFVLNKGTIVESGNFEELSADRGWFSSMMKRQST